MKYEEDNKRLEQIKKQLIKRFCNRIIDIGYLEERDIRNCVNNPQKNPYLESTKCLSCDFIDKVFENKKQKVIP